MYTFQFPTFFSAFHLHLLSILSLFFPWPFSGALGFGYPFQQLFTHLFSLQQAKQFGSTISLGASTKQWGDWCALLPTLLCALTRILGHSYGTQRMSWASQTFSSLGVSTIWQESPSSLKSLIFHPHNLAHLLSGWNAAHSILENYRSIMIEDNASPASWLDHNDMSIGPSYSAPGCGAGVPIPRDLGVQPVGRGVLEGRDLSGA